MTIKELQDNYPEIAKLIPAVETASNVEKIIGFYTSKIEQEKKMEKLKQWIEYLAQKDIMQAVSAMNKLRRITEEGKEDLIDILFSEINRKPENQKCYEMMLALLYLNEFDKASELYEYIKTSEEIELEKKNIKNEIEDDSGITRITNLLRTYLNNDKSYKKIFNNQESLLENDLYTYLLSISNEEEIEEYNNLCENIEIFIKKNEELLEKYGLKKVTKYKISNSKKENILPTIQLLKSICYKLIKKENSELLFLVIGIEQGINQLMGLYQKKIDLITKFVEFSGKTEKYYKDQSIELLEEFKEENEKIVNVLMEKIDLSKISQETLMQYQNELDKQYNVICSYKMMDMNKIFTKWIEFCDYFLEIAMEIRTEEEIRENIQI